MKLFILSLFMIPQLAVAFFQTDVSLIYKKKVEDGLVLTQEFHKTVNGRSGIIIPIKTKIGILCNLKVRFKDEFPDYGPSDMLSVDVQIKNIKLDKELFFKKNIQLHLNESHTFNFSSERGDELTLKILPKVL